MFTYKIDLKKSQFLDIASDIIASHVLETVTQQGRASLLLSGGSTPGPVYENLAKRNLAWEYVDVGLVDERWVDESDSGSNAALIRSSLLQGNAKKATFLPMKTSHLTAAHGRGDIETAYRPLVSNQSLAVLGMGTDGHVCSWFPESKGLSQALDLKNPDNLQTIHANKSKVTGDYLERMTLTLSALMSCKTILLLISGVEKKQVFESAMNSAKLPVSYLIREIDPSRLTVLHSV